MGTRLPQKGAQQPPLFGELCSGTVAHLSSCWALVLLRTAHWSSPVLSSKLDRSTCKQCWSLRATNLRLRRSCCRTFCHTERPDDLGLQHVHRDTVVCDLPRYVTWLAGGVALTQKRTNRADLSDFLHFCTDREKDRGHWITTGQDRSFTSGNAACILVDSLICVHRRSSRVSGCRSSFYRSSVR